LHLVQRDIVRCANDVPMLFAEVAHRGWLGYKRGFLLNRNDLFVISRLYCFMDVVVVVVLDLRGSLLNLLEFGLAIKITVVGVELKKGLLDLL
jgi:hypothetical protein